MNDLHSFSTPPRRLSRFAPTEKFSERKRALFPTNNKENEDSSDIGTIEPLELSSSPDRYDSPFDSPKSPHSPFSNRHTFSTLFDKITPLKIDKNEVILAPNSPISMIDSPKFTLSADIPETPTKFSPTQALKTPHDSSSVNNRVPKLVRKSLCDLTNVDKSQRNVPEKSPTQIPNLDTSLKVSKARTALFPDNIVPAKSFYPSSISDYRPSKVVFSEPLYNKTAKNTRKPRHSMYLCSRKRISKKLCGEINAGVRHGIKRPKYKQKLTKSQLLQAAEKIIEKSPLNAYLDSIKENGAPKASPTEGENSLPREQLSKMDSLLKSLKNQNLERGVPTSAIATAQSNNENVNINIPFGTGVKRPASPEPEPQDQNKKFFKSSRTNATVTINKNIKLKIDNGEMSLIEKNKRKRQKLDLDPFEIDLNVSNEEKLTVDTSFSDILKCLDEDEPVAPNQQNIVLSAFNSVEASENQIQLHAAPNKGVPDKNSVKPGIGNSQGCHMMSPTTLMGGLALNSPTKKLSSIENIAKKNISFLEMENNKMFPIFYNKSNSDTNSNKKKESSAVQNLKKINWKPLAEDQMILDAGQKKFGHTQCKECNFVYSHADPEDETMHYNYHNSINVLRFNKNIPNKSCRFQSVLQLLFEIFCCKVYSLAGKEDKSIPGNEGWKNERVVTQLGMGPDSVKIILIQPGDPKIWWKKAKDLVDVVNKELGFLNVPLDENHSKVYIYIKNKQIRGCIVAEPKTQAHKMLPSSSENLVDMCSEETFPVLCGISRIWVSPNSRKHGVATTLMNSLRCNYIYGHALSVDQIAFSSPTDAGKAFIIKYTGTQEYLVYMS